MYENTKSNKNTKFNITIQLKYKYTKIHTHKKKRSKISLHYNTVRGYLDMFICNRK